jgi:hypothetical protein
LSQQKQLTYEKLNESFGSTGSAGVPELVMNSCSKENVTPATVEEQLAPGEFLAKAPSPAPM